MSSATNLREYGMEFLSHEDASNCCHSHSSVDQLSITVPSVLLLKSYFVCDSKKPFFITDRYHLYYETLLVNNFFRLSLCKI
mmetsp:Transcript_4504/g.5587  ORF Transcript_4504/g.5587 Transcript_4504/m.5587 type:complete len:82 (-) Transcript_4504:266-511(-)